MGIFSSTTKADFVKNSKYQIDFQSIELDGASYFIPQYAAHRPACKMMLAGSYYEPATHQLVSLLFNQWSGDMIHAGTFFGDMLPSFSKKCPGTVYAFEPVLENYVLAKTCLMRNRIKNVALFNSGLGEKVEIAYMATSDVKNGHNGGASCVADDGQVTTTVAIDSLSLDQLSVLQLDVEGFELSALRGAAATIARNRPVILVEDNEHNCAEFLGTNGYAFVGEIPNLFVWASGDRVEPVGRMVQAVR